MDHSKYILIYFACSILVFYNPAHRPTENKLEKKKKKERREEVLKRDAQTNKSFWSQSDL